MIYSYDGTFFGYLSAVIDRDEALLRKTRPSRLSGQISSTWARPSCRNEALRRSYMPKKYWSFLIEMK